jgi:hypothetical protein
MTAPSKASNLNIRYDAEDKITLPLDVQIDQRLWELKKVQRATRGTLVFDTTIAMILSSAPRHGVDKTIE